MHFLTRFLLTILAAVAVVIALSASAGAQTDCYPIQPSGEGFPQVQCTDGTRWYQDMDGQPYANDAGYPVYPAGSWVQLP